MGVTDLDAKVALAESKRSSAAYVELLQYVRKEKLRAPRVVAKFGKLLIQNHSWGLGSDSTCLSLLWTREGREGGGPASVWAMLMLMRRVCYYYTYAVWSLYEQVFIASLDLHDEQLAEVHGGRFEICSFTLLLVMQEIVNC